ncbi:hypothetical protein PAMA_002776 [Pampus argenteus]
MSGEGSARRSTRHQNKQTDGTLQKIDEEESAPTLTPEAKEIDMEAVQAGLEGISKQIGDMRKEMKSDMRALKDEITAQLDEKWATFSVEINRKFDTITTYYCVGAHRRNGRVEFGGWTSLPGGSPNQCSLSSALLSFPSISLSPPPSFPLSPEEEFSTN